MKKKKSPIDLGRRERQVMAFVYQHNQATAAEVMEGIDNPPKDLSQLDQRFPALAHTRSTKPRLVMSTTTTAVALSLVLTLSLLGTGCGSTSSDVTDAWSGTIDTLASGEIVVRNTGGPVWSPEEAWQVVEEVRIGSDTGDDAILFGDVRSLDVDAHGHVHVLDSQTEEIYVFDLDGAFVRTIGTKGAGPGEFEGASSVDISRNGEIWVMEMQKGRLSILDSNGEYVRTGQVNSTGWDYWNYPGGFDRMGRYNAMVLSFDEEGTTELLARFDQFFAPLDTIPLPASPEESERFQIVRDGGASTMTVPVPFTGSFDWSFSSSGNFWTLFTETYELVEITASGKALRRVIKEFEPSPVTTADIEAAIESLTWFINQGGKVDLSRFPKTKPIITSFFSDDEGNIWVMRVATSPEDEGRLFDLFTPKGQFLGMIRLPFSLDSGPEPIVRNGWLYGITEDELGAENVVIARIEKS